MSAIPRYSRPSELSRWHSQYHALLFNISRTSAQARRQHEAAIKTETILGAKMLELTSRGEGKLSGTIPLERTHSPYDLPDALGTCVGKLRDGKDS